MSRPAPALLRLILPASVALLTVALYVPALDGPFIYDDVFHIQKNQALRDLGDPVGVLKCGYQETRPLYLLSLALNFQLTGESPQGFHLVNLGLHLLCGLLLFYLGRATARDLRRGDGGAPLDVWAPALGALLFLVHPMATESVAYINSRSGLLAAALGLGALLLFVRSQTPRGRGRQACHVASLVLALLAMCSKESAAVLPLLMGLYLWLLRGARGWQAVRPVLPHLALVVVVPLLFLWGKDPHQGTVGAGTIPLIHHWLTQPRVLVTFWSLLLLPLEQNLDYDFRLSTTPLDPAFLGAVLVLVGILGVAVWARRRLPVFSFGILFFFVAIAPTNSLLPFVDFIAERHVYLPMAGFCLAFVALLSLLADRIPKLRRFIIGATLFYALCLGLLAVARNRVLANPLALWQQTAQASPNKGRPYLNLGVHLMQRGKLEQGLRALRRAEKLDPEHPRIQYNLGAYWERRGDLVRAELAFGRATIRATNPMYSRALARVLGRQGAAAYQASDLERAHAYFSRAAKVDGGYVKARFNLAVTLRALGRLIPAREALEEVLRQEPGHKKAQRILGELSR